MRIVDVLVQSAAAYALALMVAAIATIFLVTSEYMTTGPVNLSLFEVLNYESTAILPFVSVRTFGGQILDKV